jgi:hypothetical protein
MKKQLIASAVAASMSAVAMADISITGNANYEYFHTTTGGATEVTRNYGDTEVNLSVVGKSGDTSVVANFELTGHGGDNADGTGIDIEDLYLTTKVGDVTVKAGDYASGTTALGGEIDNGGRVTDKVSLTMPVGPASVSYATNVGTGTGRGDTTQFDNDGSSVTVSMPIAGVNFAIKDQSDSYTITGANGSLGGINFRVENKDSENANEDVLFYEVGTKIGDLSVSYAAIDADAASLVTENDSSVFARDMASGSTSHAGHDGISQVTVATSVDGTAVKLRAGSLDGIASYKDANFMEVMASRPLASGATLTVTYADYENANTSTSSTMYDNQVLEIDLSVKF